MEREILEALLKHDITTMIRLDVSNFVKPVNFLKSMKSYVRNKIVVILPPEGNDEVLAMVKAWAMRDFPNVAIIVYRSFSVDKNEVLLGF